MTTKTIFMTGGGGSGTIAATKALKASGKYRVILGDMDSLAAGLRFADKSYVIPAAKDAGFIKRIKDIIERERVDIFVPLVDEEILKSYELKEDFPGLKLLLPERAFAELTLDKWLLVKELEKRGIPHPRTRLASDGVTGLVFPLIAKPREGRGSRNVMELASKEQINAYKTLLDIPADRMLLQEKISGREFTVSVVVDGKGRVLAVVPKEVIYKRGPTIVAVTRKNPAIEELGARVQDELGANGCFNIQLVLREDGVPVIFEINPRYSTTIALTIASGVNEIDMVADDSEPGRAVSFKEGLVMSRYYDQLYFEEE